MKYIIVTGGVCSSLGKGVAAASIGALLKCSGMKVFSQKLDPYLNVDPGTMSPFQHGEVFVTDDGAETDLDLGHYERFIDQPITKLSNITSGKIYSDLITKERRGDFLGATIQIIPHVTTAIKDFIKNGPKATGDDISIVEIGGTVGDIEGQPFIEAVRQLRLEHGRENVLFVHLTLLPYLEAAGELKTKPTQTSVRELRSYGIQPDIIMCRSDKEIPDELLTKISQFCDVHRDAVIPMETVDSIYNIPCHLDKTEVVNIISDQFKLDLKKPEMKIWEDYMGISKKTGNSLRIGLLGKYVGLDDAYISIIESLKFSCQHEGFDLDLVWLDSEAIENDGIDKLKEVDGVLVPGGFGNRGTKGKIAGAKYCRENNLPYFGICLGMQIATIEYALHVAGIEGATSQEFNPDAPNQVIAIMDEQKNLTEKGATMRLGSFPCTLKEGTISMKAYGESQIDERHRHRFEFNNNYRQKLEDAGLIISGTSPDDSLVEIVEIPDHPFMVGAQFHPEFKSRPYRPHPLFSEFIKSVIKSKND